MPSKVYACKTHKYTHLYTVCPDCRAQYCDRMWVGCPNRAWHPAHADTDAEYGRRQRALDEVRRTREA